MAVQRKQAYEALKAAAQPFMDNYHCICESMVFSHDWFSGKAWAWHDVLAPMRGESVEILEVGVFEGRSVVFCLEYLPLSKVIAVDHFVIRRVGRRLKATLSRSTPRKPLIVTSLVTASELRKSPVRHGRPRLV
jgi:hypothetical protein